MLIPNYDNLINKKKNNFNSYIITCQVKVLWCWYVVHQEVERQMHMLLKPLIYYDKVYLYTKNIDQEKYQLLANELNKMAKKNKFSVDKIYEYSNSSIKDVDELENNYKK